MILTSLYNGLRFRIGPASTYAQVSTAPTYLDKGQTVEVTALSGTEGQEQWAQAGIDRWINVWHAGSQNATLLGALPPPPPPAGHHIEVVIDGVVEWSKDL